MSVFTRKLVQDFSYALSSDEARAAQDNCADQTIDFFNRVETMWKQGNSECAVIWERIEATDYFTYCHVDVKNIMNLFKLFGPEWRESKAPSDDPDVAVLNQFKYPNICYLARTAESFLKSYNSLSSLQQSALDYVIEPYADVILDFIRCGAYKADKKSNDLLGQLAP